MKADKGVTPKDFLCSVRSRPQSTIYWYKEDGSRIINDDTKYQIRNMTTAAGCGSQMLQSTLKILNVNENDTGLITCGALFVGETTTWLNQSTNFIVQCK